MTLSVAAFGALVVVAAAAASWESIRGEWYVAQLDSDDRVTVRRAIVRLGELSYKGALSNLIGIVELDFHTSAREALHSLEQVSATSSDATKRQIVAALLGVLARDENKDWASRFFPVTISTVTNIRTINGTQLVDSYRMEIRHTETQSFSSDAFVGVEKFLPSFDSEFRERVVKWIVEDIASSSAWSRSLSHEGDTRFPSPSEWPEESISREVMTRLLAEGKRELMPIEPSWPFRREAK